MDLIPYLSVSIVSFLWLLFAGIVIEKVLLRHVSIDKPYTKLFVQLMLGLVTTVLFYSVIKSGGKTFNLAIIPVLILGYFESKRMAKPLATNTLLWKDHLPGVMPLLVSLSVLCFYVVFKYFENHIGGAMPWVPTLGADYVQHAVISEALSMVGVENKFAPEVVMDAKFQGLFPYHYFDLWLNALITDVSGNNGFLTLHMVTYPLVIVVGYLGVLTIWETQQKVSLLVALFSLFLVCFGALHFDTYNSIHYLSKENYRLNHFGENALTMPKILQYLPFATAFVALLIKQYFRAAFLVLTLLIMVYFSALVMLGVLGAFVLVNLVRPIWVERKDAFVIGVNAFVPLVVFIGVYLLMSKGIEGTRDSFDLKLTDTGYMRTRINILGLSTIQTGVMYAPYVLSIALMALTIGLKKAANKTTILLLSLALLVYAAGVSGWVIALESVDGMQLVGNNMPIANMLLVGLAIIVFSTALTSQKSKIGLVMGSVMFATCLLYATVNDMNGMIDRKHTARKQSVSYLQSIGNEFVGEKDLMGAYLKGDEEYRDPQYSVAHKISQSFKLDLYVAPMEQYYSSVNLSVFEIPFSDPQKDALKYKREKNAIEATIFYLFVAEQKKAGTFVSVAQSQVDFIKKYNIKYLVVSRSAFVPKELEELTERFFVDENTEERFIVLKAPQ